MLVPIGPSQNSRFPAVERRAACVVLAVGLLRNGHYRTLKRINLRLKDGDCLGQCFCCGLFGCQKLEKGLNVA